MQLQLLLVTAVTDEIPLMQELLASALSFTCLAARMNIVDSRATLFEQIGEHAYDVVLLDWELVQEETPNLVKQILEFDPRLRIVVLLPLNNRLYRQKVWEAGACNGIPKEHMDQEWLATVLCLMTRAIQREEKIRMAYLAKENTNLIASASS